MTTVHPYIHLQTKANSKNINKLNSKSSETSISCNENKSFMSTNKLYKPTYLCVYTLDPLPRAIKHRPQGPNLWCGNKNIQREIQFRGIRVANITMILYFSNFERIYVLLEDWVPDAAAVRGGGAAGVADGGAAAQGCTCGWWHRTAVECRCGMPPSRSSAQMRCLH